jgi:DNA-binding CsgD family transcriptional regulator/PAS domain-containing protein
MGATKPTKPTFQQAAQRLMDAAIDPSQWAPAMEALGDYAGATGAVLLPVKGQSPGTPHSQSLGEGLETYFRDGWHERDERTRGLPLIQQRGIFTDQDFASSEELASSDYYRGLLARFDCNWSAVVGFSDPVDEWCLVFQRGDRAGFFDRAEQDDLVRFARPLHQAAALARSLAFAAATGALDAYQAIGCASFLIDQSGYVVQHNQKAQELIGNGLELRRRQLRAMHPPDNAELEALIASHRPGRSDKAPPTSVALVRRHDRRPLVVRAIALAGLAAAVFARGAILLLVTDPDAQSAPTTPDTLTRMFGLTEAEAVIVMHLEQELPLTAVATRMSISVETARTHLKRILTKTQTHRQQDLLLLLRRLQP